MLHLLLIADQSWPPMWGFLVSVAWFGPRTYVTASQFRSPTLGVILPYSDTT